MSDYRKIYEQHNGAIPKDKDGRHYEIHHIDGNRKNDNPSNLIALTIQEHYDIHYAQGDWGACQNIMIRMNKTPEEISKTCRGLAIKNNHRRVEDGTHNFLGPESNRKRIENGTHNFLGGEIPRKTQRRRVAAGVHHFLGGEISGKTSRRRVADGTHPFLGPENSRKNNLRRMTEGTHHFITNNPCKTIVKCPYCPKEGPAPQMKQWHFDNCKKKPK